MNKFFNFLFLAGSFIYFMGCERKDEEPVPIDEIAINLLDDDLSYWYKWLGVPHHSVAGLPPGTPTGNGMEGIPLGLDDPKEVFKVIELDGEKVLKVTGEIYGALTTKEEYENYHLRLEYKWGKIKWEPRVDEPRDMGIIYHCTGKNEEGLWNVFMMGLENQISEGSSGDLFLLPNYDRTFWPIGKSRINEGGFWNKNVPLKAVGGEGEIRQRRSENFESDNDSRTVMEVFALGTTAIHLVNGQVVMVVEDIRLQYDNGSTTPLKKGKIQLQSEGAEGFYKNITIKNITEFPDEISDAAGLLNN